jgi:hypothetical protein
MLFLEKQTITFYHINNISYLLCRTALKENNTLQQQQQEFYSLLFEPKNNAIDEHYYSRNNSISNISPGNTDSREKSTTSATKKDKSIRYLRKMLHEGW